MISEHEFALVGETEDSPLRFVLRPGDNLFGSGHRADVLARFPGISKCHARITVRAADVLIEDLASKNGTVVNGRRVDSGRLAPGDVLKLGVLRLELVAQAAPAQRLAIHLAPVASRSRSFESATATMLAGWPSAPTSLRFPEGFVVATSAPMQAVYRELARAAPSAAPVLILGETGTGKELIARTVHDSSPRRRRPFLAVNCAAIPAEMLEAELFGVGHRVATGVDRREGIFSRADRGTLFLDEIGDMPLPLQAKLLRVLESGRIDPLGGGGRPVDVRIVAATHADLEPRAAAGDFRADLFYRLAGFVLRLPALRERPEDIPALVERRLVHHARTINKPLTGMTEGALASLMSRAWPGNVRELDHVLRRLVARCAPHQPIVSALLEDRSSPPPSPTEATPPSPSRPLAGFASLDLRQLERQAIEEALARADGNQTRAAKMLNISRFALHRRLSRE